MDIFIVTVKNKFMCVHVQMCVLGARVLHVYMGAHVCTVVCVLCMGVFLGIVLYMLCMSFLCVCVLQMSVLHVHIVCDRV